MPTRAEERRNRLLAQLTKIIEHFSGPRVAFQAPEVILPAFRSALYDMMMKEFAACADFHVGGFARALGLPSNASTAQVMNEIARCKSR